MVSGGSTGGGSSSVLQSKGDCKFQGRLLSKETSLANPSFRVYYSVAAAGGSVPFLWESRPGTPKHTSSSAALPPLTPPPSYFSSPCSRARTSSTNKPPGSKYSFLSLPKLLALKKAAATGDGSAASISLSSSRSFSSSSSSCSPRSDHRRRPSDEDEEAEFSGSRSPTSTLCFGVPIFLAMKKN